MKSANIPCVWPFDPSQRLVSEPLTSDPDLDTTLDTTRVKYRGPIYQGPGDSRIAAVPLEAVVGDRIYTFTIGDSSDREQIHEIVSINPAVMEERAGHYPLAECRQAVVRLVGTGRSHMDRIMSRSSS